ncbi:hypothetical protein IFM89_001808 [Coptis chinensis]|uniref:Seven-in-absentia protein TRAF-like domain-containing protein n=1 Tax=Coptis chinensis TaxID=261450 RepID=A0A835HKA1_9MAGN|nr:hypothetical protein IFM89_001808 [Coptis chinensis]
MVPVYMAFLCFMGDETEARNFSYSLEVGAICWKLIWEGTPRSIPDTHCIQRNMALFFSGGRQEGAETAGYRKEQQIQIECAYQTSVANTKFVVYSFV